ncbi:MFS transporter [Pseudonocardia sulfidoxydans NBRC 16205]|uniref:MFS transporter n=1 Tax=Pseudonocardia sulfidoxydans NBRC 16205 TaxID=1223511 RepID=A0A511DHR0_9PSEU|nr:MFS transporter [Pseudonocardia sulfidoxydans]GEL24037.1 MFS transporter [Pseudonocardia sulfidoxydans NBRC 16205]
MRIAILPLALGTFAIGLTEFAVMGLLPQIAQGLDVSVPAAGMLVTAYAIGVVVGAPLLTAVSLRLPRTRMLMLFMGMFAVGNALAAVAPSFGVLVALRFLTGLPHGAFFGVASLVAASLVAEERRARAIAAVFLGLTVSNVLGVPAATALGSVVGWRIAFAVIVVVALASVAGIAILVPRTGIGTPARLGSELAVFRQPAVLLVLGMIVLGCGGLFAFYSYIAPVMTGLAGFGEGAVPVLLGVFGLGMTLGTVLGGRLADRVDPRRVMAALLAAQAVLLAVAVVALHTRWLAALVVFGVGLLGLALIPAVQSVVLDAARDAPVLASAAIHSAFNIANAIGAALGGVVLAAGFGLGAPSAVGAALAAVGVLLALVSMRVAARRPAAAVA